VHELVAITWRSFENMMAHPATFRVKRFRSRRLSWQYIV